MNQRTSRNNHGVIAKANNMPKLALTLGKTVKNEHWLERKKNEKE
jgi:hypothetical protein